MMGCCETSERGRWCDLQSICGMRYGWTIEGRPDLLTETRLLSRAGLAIYLQKLEFI